jgi:hypothetical protein
MKYLYLIRVIHRPARRNAFWFLASLLLLIAGCITEFIPVTDEKNELLVVEGMVTDQPEAYSVKISKSVPLGKKSEVKPFSGCIVSISDDLGQSFDLQENSPGIYLTNQATFIGVIGRSYKLHISATVSNRIINYESTPEELKAVPPIDSVYYEKTIIAPATKDFPLINGCQIYLNTHDPADSCKFYRWDFSETWEIRLHWPVDHQMCWVTENSPVINLKNTSGFAESTVSHFPINFISNTTDRLITKYSIIVNQYSLNEDEFLYWEKIQNITQQVGGLYDIVPSSVPGNMQCIENPDESVLGYFSVSAKSSRRIFIKDYFSGLVDPYSNFYCIDDTIPTDYPYGYPGFGIEVWALYIQLASFTTAPYTILTRTHACADCTVRGSEIRPDFWTGDK